jgi:hypothetical protein
MRRRPLRIGQCDCRLVAAPIAIIVRRLVAGAAAVSTARTKMANTILISYLLAIDPDCEPALDEPEQNLLSLLMALRAQTCQRHSRKLNVRQMQITFGD